MQEVLWTLICLADDDPLCREAIIASHALPAIVPLLTAAPFDPPINDFICLPALAARALRALLEDSPISASTEPGISSEDCDAHGQQHAWQQDAVSYLVQMLSASSGHGKDGNTGYQQLTRVSSGLNQRLRKFSVLSLDLHLLACARAQGTFKWMQMKQCPS